jgi:aspartyl-tRNA synthetase
VAHNASVFSRKDFDELSTFVQDFGVKGLLWIKVGENGAIDSPAKKFLSEQEVKQLLTQTQAVAGDVIFIIASTWAETCKALGALRLKLVERLKIAAKNPFEILWVVDFPLLEWNEEEKRFQACHHPFTSPRPSDLEKLSTHPGEVKARAYDLVLNGTEIGGGSIRIHQEEVQEKVFQTLGIQKDEAHLRFGFLLSALKFSAPPHGGIALGLDRLTAVLLGLDSIREVIAFPKTQKGLCLMSEAPSQVSDKQLKEAHIQIKK